MGAKLAALGVDQCRGGLLAPRLVAHLLASAGEVVLLQLAAAGALCVQGPRIEEDVALRDHVLLRDRRRIALPDLVELRLAHQLELHRDQLVHGRDLAGERGDENRVVDVGAREHLFAPDRTHREQRVVGEPKARGGTLVEVQQPAAELPRQVAHDESGLTLVPGRGDGSTDRGQVLSPPLGRAVKTLDVALEGADVGVGVDLAQLRHPLGQLPEHPHVLGDAVRPGDLEEERPRDGIDGRVGERRRVALRQAVADPLHDVGALLVAHLVQQAELGVPVEPLHPPSLCVRQTGNQLVDGGEPLVQVGVHEALTEGTLSHIGSEEQPPDRTCTSGLRQLDRTADPRSDRRARCVHDPRRRSRRRGAPPLRPGAEREPPHGHRSSSGRRGCGR